MRVLVTASIYPIAVLVVLILAGSGMMIFVIPSLIGMLKEGGLKEQDFPVMTKFLISISNILLNYWEQSLYRLIFYMLKKDKLNLLKQ